MLRYDVRQPRFIETVSISACDAGRNETSATLAQTPAQGGLPSAVTIALAGMAGGAGAGLFGGLIYGYAVALARATPATGAVLVLVGVITLCLLVASSGVFWSASG